MTTLSNIINPQVMADMISAELPNALQVSKLYKVDRTLTGKAGNTITVPQWAYIGAAADLAEGVEGTVTQMTASADKEYTVKKAVKNVELTDEALLSGYGDPKGEAVRQLKLAIADKVDNDGIALLKGITSATTGAQFVASEATALGYDVVCEALDLFSDEEQGGDKVLLVDAQGIKDLRKDTRFVDKYSDTGVAMMASGVVGRIAGCEVVISNKLNPASGKTHKAIVMKPNAITAFIKRDVTVETARNILAKTTTISADEHYVCAIEDMTKIAVIEYTTE
jgi:N4-gp56 family major capsid protein